MFKRMQLIAACAGVGAVARDAAWLASLKSEGYLVREGIYDLFTTQTCAHADTCYALNPATPYGLFYFPPHAQETTDGGYNNTWCSVHNMCQEQNGETYSASWRVADGEAIVILGQTPPESAYWSVTPYLYSRFNDADFQPHPKRASDVIVECPHGPSRCEVFTGVNDPLNFQTVNTTDGNPFGAQVAIVLSWDSEVQQEVARKLESAHVGPVNHLEFPGAIGRLGVTSGTEDEYMALIRVAGIKHQEDADAYYSSKPYRIFRVSRPLDKPPAAESAHPSFDGKMRTRWTGKNESTPDATNDELRDGVRKLKEMVIEETTHFHDYTTMNFESFVNDSGYECLEQGLKCQGDCRDTIYAKATLIPTEALCDATHIPCKPSQHSELSAGKDDAYYVIGVNHKMTKQSTYSSMTFYNFPKLAAAVLETPDGRVKASMMDTDYEGSANALLPEHSAAPYLYLIKYARHCGSSEKFLCVEVPDAAPDANSTAMALNDQFVFIERMYIHPGTKSGPDVAETVLPVLIHVKPRHAEQIAQIVV